MCGARALTLLLALTGCGQRGPAQESSDPDAPPRAEPGGAVSSSAAGEDVDGPAGVRFGAETAAAARCTACHGAQLDGGAGPRLPRRRGWTGATFVADWSASACPAAAALHTGDLTMRELDALWAWARATSAARERSMP